LCILRTLSPSRSFVFINTCHLLNMLNSPLTNMVLLHNFYLHGSHTSTNPIFSNFSEVSRMLLLKKGVMLCTCIPFIIFFINFQLSNLLSYPSLSNWSHAHNGMSHITWPSHWCNIVPINPLMFLHHPQSPFTLSIVLNNLEPPRIPTTQKAMPMTSSMTPILHHSLLILLFYLHSHDQAPHGCVPYLLSPHSPFSHIPIPHYNWIITIFLLLYKPYTFDI
jgi:hypothetical protein